MFFDKPFDALSIDDVRWLIDTQVTESTDLEFKRELAGEKNNPDPWQSGADKIGRAAVAAIVKELVAFANAGGGSLLVGVGESQDKPARANSIAPIRAAHALADRLKRLCRDNIEPPMFGLDVRALTPVGEDAGVIVLRVAESPYGPHRSRCDRECYLRKNEDSVPMTMDEIHRRVIDMNRRHERIDAWFAQQRPKNIEDGWLLRAAARPLGPFQLPRIHGNSRARPVIQPIVVRSKNGNGWRTEMWASGLNWRPIVRGTRCLDTIHNGAATELRLYEDGSIVFDWHWHGPFDDRDKNIYMEWFSATFGNLLLAVERLRLVTNNPVEYVAEVYVAIKGATFRRKPYWDNWYGSSGAFEPGISTLGPYPVGDSSAFSELSKLLENDVCHLAGSEASDVTFFDYTPQLGALRSELGIVS